MTTYQISKDHAVPALAQYAYTRLEPLFAQAKAVYPELQWTIKLTFADADSKYSDISHLSVYTLGTTTEFYASTSSYVLTDMETIDAYTSQVADAVKAVTA